MTPRDQHHARRRQGTPEEGDRQKGKATGKGRAGEQPASLPPLVYPCAPLAVASSHCDAWRQLSLGAPRGSLALRDRVYGRGELAGPSHWKWWQSADASPGCAGVVPAVRSHSAGPPATADRGGPAHHRGSPHRPGSPTARKAVAHLACAPIAADALGHRTCEPHAGLGTVCAGVELPFWLVDRIHWRWGVLLLRRSDALRVCCAPWRLRLPGGGAAVQAALARLEIAVTALTTATP